MLIEEAYVTPGTAEYSSEGKNKPYYVSIEILSSAIQADPARAVESAWPAVQVENGQLKAK